MLLTGSPAEKAGVRPTTRDERGRLILGDVITGIDNERITNSTDLFRALDNRSVGDTVKVCLLLLFASLPVQCVKFWLSGLLLSRWSFSEGIGRKSRT